MDELKRQAVLDEIYRLEQRRAELYSEGSSRLSGIFMARNLISKKLAWRRALLDPEEERRRRLAARP